MIGRKIIILTFVIVAMVAYASISIMQDLNNLKTDDVILTLEKERDKNSKPSVILGYVTSWSKELPNPYSVTHLSYAFATIDDDFESLTIKNEERFKEIVNLKSINQKLNILLSIGGWGAGNFSEMASTVDSRSNFIHNAMEIVRRYNLDGLDIDWEYPGSSLGKISSSKKDKSNFTKLIKQLRDSLGTSKYLSFASPSYGVYFDYKEVTPYVDFINVMTYDMNVPPLLHSPLNHSEHTGKTSIKDVIVNHYRNGVSVDKILLGIPFYGRGNEKDYKKFQDYRYIQPMEGTELRYDSIAETPYIVDSQTEELLISFDDTTSIKIKCKFVKDIGLRGVMFWHYCGDTKDHELLKVINSELN